MKFSMRAQSALVSMLAAGACFAQSAAPSGANPAPAIPSTAQVSPSPQPGAEVAAAAAPCCTLAKDTVVEIEIAETLNSAQQKPGDKFKLRLAEPVMQAGVPVLPAGVEGVGEIIDAGPSRGGGAPGKLIVAARYLDYDGVQLRLHAMKLGGAGKDTIGASLGAGIVIGPFAMFIKGHNMEFPAGTRAQAKLGAAVNLPPLAPQPVPAPANANVPSTSPLASPAASHAAPTTPAPSTQE
ncbi:MAG: hypothetical protein JSR34_09985 [Proteobacteria bacterium]|nr:hypothetical protein [Pseudomonadota bacterium]